MATKILKYTKDGEPYYRLRYRVKKDSVPLSMVWHFPNTWSDAKIQRELAKVEAQFEEDCRAGKILSRNQQKEKAAAEAEAKAEAERKEAAIFTLKRYGEEIYMPKKALENAETTRSFYQAQLDKHIYPVLGAYKITDITPAQITALLTEYRSSGAAFSSLTAVYTTLHQLFKMAYLNDAIDRNPMDKVEKPRRTKETLKNEDKEAFSPEEVAHIYKCLNNEKLKWRTYIMLLIDSGIRNAEALGLQWDCVDIKHNQITIKCNLLYTQEKGVYLDTPKTGKQRTIDIDPGVMSMLMSLKHMQLREGLISAFVFTQDHSTDPMHPDSPATFCKRFSKKNGIDHLHPHKLRHTFATIAIINGADIVSVSGKLGHSRKSTTLDMYSHANQEGMKKASEIFRNAIAEAQQKKA